MKQRKVALGAATAVLASVAILVGGVAANAAAIPTPSPSASVTPKPIPTQSPLANPGDVYTDPQWSLYDYDTSNPLDQAMLSAAAADTATPLTDLGKTGDAGPRATAPPFGIIASIDPDVEPVVAKSANGTSTTAVTFYLSMSTADPYLQPRLTGYSTITILLDGGNGYVGCALQVVTTETLPPSSSGLVWVLYASRQSWSMASDTGSYQRVDGLEVDTGQGSPHPIIYPSEDVTAPMAVALSRDTKFDLFDEHANGGPYDYSDYVAASALSETVTAEELVNAESYPLWSNSLMG